MSDPVLDASALLAWLNGEPDAGPVAEVLVTGAAISSVISPRSSQSSSTPTERNAKSARSWIRSIWM